MTTARIGDPVAVDWLDAWVDHGETDEKLWKDACPVTTFGVLKRRGKVVTVASEIVPDGEYRCVTHIPAGMVKRIRRLA